LEERDEDGYPTEELLDAITNWPHQKGFTALMEVIRRNWNWNHMMFEQEGNKYSCSTGGWSGNESLISALKANKDFFWTLCWVSSRRGGHYEFEVPEAFINPQPTE
jgi:hypothetical protein